MIIMQCCYVLHFPSFLFGRAKPPIYYFVFKFYLFSFENWQQNAGTDESAAA